MTSRREARYLFEISRNEWGEDIRDAQRAQNARLAEGIERWRAPLVASGELLPMTPAMFVSQLIGPAQIFCRAFLSGRDRADPRGEADTLIACAIRALVPPGRITNQEGDGDMSDEADPEFAPIAERIHANVGRQGFMNLVGAELSELSRGTCTIAVERRPELLQQHGFFHGGVTAFLVDNATTIAAATSRGQPALTAEYKLNLLSPAVGESLICRARVIKPGRQVSVVAADVFCVIDGVEKHTATALASIAMLTRMRRQNQARRLRRPGFVSLARTRGVTSRSLPQPAPARRRAGLPDRRTRRRRRSLRRPRPGLPCGSRCPRRG